MATERRVKAAIFRRINRSNLSAVLCAVGYGDPAPALLISSAICPPRKLSLKRGSRGKVVGHFRNVGRQILPPTTLR
ncbi:MAG: hypothetical protein Q8Q88_00005 [Phenylobacterium sp.]|uniref:hypothetical protein n=1 Tax=Phenylobacterium sp. TaxID=1871053 RepID=UPI002735FD79|nr:hypothetical protein [Phenylobacterium sp.]MDP3745405.1 hypothetical protein [Phenylobacterium sp.]